MTTLTTEQKNIIQKIWSEDFLNLKSATRAAIDRDNKTAYFAIDVGNTVFKNGYNDVYSQALSALKTLTESKRIKWFIWSTTTQKDFEYVNSQLFIPNGIKFDFYNENPEMLDIGFDLRRPFYDVMIDAAAGFKPENSWFWIEQIIKFMDKMIPEPSTQNYAGMATPNPFETRNFDNIPVARPVNSGFTSRSRRAIMGERLPDRVYNNEKGIWESK